MGTPMKPGQLQKLRTEKENEKESVMEETVLRSHVGKLLWLALCTRPDIAQTVSRLAGTINLRSDCVREIIFRICHYLNETKEYGIHYTRNGILDVKDNEITEKEWKNEESKLMKHTDADHMGCPFNLGTTVGFSIYLYNNLFCFTTTKQKCNAANSTVAEVLDV